MTVLAAGFVVADHLFVSAVQRTFHGRLREQWSVQDLSSRSLAALGA